MHRRRLGLADFNAEANGKWRMHVIARTISLFKKNTSHIDRTLFIGKRHFLKKQIQNKVINLKNRNYFLF